MYILNSGLIHTANSNEVLDQGTSLLDIAREKHAAAELARKKRTEAYNGFSQKKALIEEKFKEARRKSDIIFLPMGNLSSWMGKFFALSRNTFKQQPQLMESFSIVVKS